MSRKRKIWTLAFLVWGAGAAVICYLWYNRIFESDTADSILGFVLYGIAFFYVYAIFPIHEFLNDQLFLPPPDSN